MKKPIRLLAAFLSLAVTLFVAGCESNEKVARNHPTPAPTPDAAVSQPAIPAANVPPAEKTLVRINAGASSPMTDSSGNVWLADQGFDGGDTVERSELTITNTTQTGIYCSEHYAMDSFTWPLANGKYLVQLHFCETYDGITGPGQRVFSFNVQGREFKDFDVWSKAGGPLTPHVEIVPVEITDNKLLITFTSSIENPQINGIEIIPQP